MGRDVVAVVPAAGLGTRLGETVPGSKEAADVGGRPAAAHVLGRLESSGITRALFVLRQGKWDVPAALVGCATVDIAYVIVEDSPSELFSVIRGLRFTGDDLVALAYPDVLFEPRSAFGSLLERLDESGADVVLGLFPSDIPERVDMVVLDDELTPTEIVIKQPDRGLEYSWSIAVWTPAFSTYLIDYATGIPDSAVEGRSVGDAIQRAIGDGLPVAAVAFEEGSYLDIGTPADLDRARDTAKE